MKISSSAQEYFEEFIYNNYPDIRIRNDYSGRCMYGDRCLGISGQDYDLSSFMIDLIAEAPKKIKTELKKVLKSVHKDQLGLGMIYYFPGFQFESCEE